MPSAGSSADAPPEDSARPRIRVMTVDDHPIYRDGLASLIGLYDDLELVAEAGDGAVAVELFRAHRPDVTLMDLSMPGISGAEAIDAITTEFPGARIIALTTYEGDADIRRALDAGARGYLIKSVVRTELADAIRAVHCGHQAIPAAVAHRLAQFTRHVELTDREVEVLRLLAKGLRNKDVARAIGRTEATVKAHVLHILQKLEVADRTEAVTVGLQRGIIHLD